MMEPTGVDRRPGMEVPVKTPIRTSRFAHLAKAGREVIADFFVNGACGVFRLGSSLRLRWLLFRELLRQRHMEALSADRRNFCLLTAVNPRPRRPQRPQTLGPFL